MLITSGVGRVTRDAETRSVGSAGTQVCNFTIATDSGFGDKKITTFSSVAVWGKEAEWCGQNIKKGDRVAVSGNSYLRKWEKDGKSGAELTIETNKVEKLWDKKDGGEGSGGGYGGGRGGGSTGYGGSNGGGTSGGSSGGGGAETPPYTPDDSIPF